MKITRQRERAHLKGITTSQMRGLELMESRFLFAADPVFVGAVYIEEDLGNDLSGDAFEITFDGGAEGTQLVSAVIDGDQNQPGFGVGDVFFDTWGADLSSGRLNLGADSAFAFTVVENQGIDSIRQIVVDGTTRLELFFDGFDAGDKLVFSIDVDEVEDYSSFENDPVVINDGFDPITSGVEFQGSTFTALFDVPHYQPAQSVSEFRNRYDDQLADSNLQLSPDNVNGKRDRTAGTVNSIQQEIMPAKISGHVFYDRNQNGLLDENESGIPNVQLTIRPRDTVQPQPVVTVLTDENGAYAVDELMPGDYIIEESQPIGYLDGLDSAGTVDGLPVGIANNPGDTIDKIFLPGGGEGVDYNFGEILPTSLQGQVHLANEDGDCFGDNIVHEPIEDAVIQLYDALGELIAQTRTNSEGAYRFEGLIPGIYSVVEITPDGLLDGGAQAGTVAGRFTGQVVSANQITNIVLESGQNGIEFDFCEIEPVSISGQVHLSSDDLDCFGEDVYHEPLAGVVVELLDANGQVVQQTITNPLGEYQFLDLAPGTYAVREITPEGLLDGGARPGFVDGFVVGQVFDPSHISEITLGPGQQALRVDFCEIEPVSITGQVHLSTPDGDCFGEGIHHQPISGVQIQLYDSDGQLVDMTETNEQGQYAFLELMPGDYSIVEQTPLGFIDGGARQGVVDGLLVGQVLDANRIMDIELNPGQHGIQFDFCEHVPASISGFVYHDENNDGQFDTHEQGISFAEVMLIDDSGSPIDISITDENGRYEFTNVIAGRYSLQELQPFGWLDGIDTQGFINGVAQGIAESDLDEIWDIELKWGDVGERYNFGELLPSLLSGNVHLGTPDGDCFSESVHHDSLEDVLVQLLDESGRIVQETRTDELGNYEFLDLLPGTYQVRQTTPIGLLEGGARAGQVNGLTIGNVVDTNAIQRIEIRSNQQAVDYDFCDFPPATISGFVFHDANNDAARDADESPIAGTTILLMDDDGNLVRETLSDERGFYQFRDLRAGNYSIREIHPEGWMDGTDTAGTVRGQTRGLAENPGDQIFAINLQFADHGIEFNFAELMPARISGFVHSDFEVSNCLYDPQRGDELLADVPIELWNQAGALVKTTITDAFGRFAFENLRPGIYSIREIQPEGYFDGSARVADVVHQESPNLIADIRLDSGQSLDHFVFCEDPPVELSGFVFQDGDAISVGFGNSVPADLASIRDGQRTVDDKPLADVMLELRVGPNAAPFDSFYALDGFYSDGTARVMTDANGFYRFSGLRKGIYAVYEFQPDGFFDGIDTGGSVPDVDGIPLLHPVPVNQGDPESEIIRQSLPSDAPTNDSILRIQLPPGTASFENNFSEVVIASRIIPSLDLPQPTQSITAPPANLVDLVVDRQRWPVELGTYRIGSTTRFLGKGSTWHLSVIDGGSPRGSGESVLVVGPVWLADGEKYGTGWQVENDRAYVWSFVSDEVDFDSIFGIENGIPIMGDFNGDGKSEQGFFFEGNWFLDINGNETWDADDLWAKLGHKGDQPIVGDWDGDGKDDIGIFGRAWPGDPRAIAEEPGLPDKQNTVSGKAKNMPPRRVEATQGNRTLQLTESGEARSDRIDHVFHFGGTGDHAVSGDWNGDGVSNIGVFVRGRWRLDRDGDGRFTDKDERGNFGKPGDLPVVGDFNGDGMDEIGIYRDGIFILDTNGNRELDPADVVIMSEQGMPIVGDVDGNGKDEVGIVRAVERPVEIQARK